jgi:hypothetical protein
LLRHLNDVLENEEVGLAAFPDGRRRREEAHFDGCQNPEKGRLRILITAYKLTEAYTYKLTEAYKRTEVYKRTEAEADRAKPEQSTAGS